MTHYTCTACEGVAELPGVCQTADCPQNGDILADCTCEDGRHAELKQKQKEQSEEDLA